MLDHISHWTPTKFVNKCWILIKLFEAKGNWPNTWLLLRNCLCTKSIGQQKEISCTFFLIVVKNSTKVSFGVDVLAVNFHVRKLDFFHLKWNSGCFEASSEPPSFLLINFFSNGDVSVKVVHENQIIWLFEWFDQVHDNFFSRVYIQKSNVVQIFILSI